MKRLRLLHRNVVVSAPRRLLLLPLDNLLKRRKLRQRKTHKLRLLRRPRARPM